MLDCIFLFLWLGLIFTYLLIEKAVVFYGAVAILVIQLLVRKLKKRSQITK